MESECGVCVELDLSVRAEVESECGGKVDQHVAKTALLGNVRTLARARLGAARGGTSFTFRDEFKDFGIHV